MEDKKRLLEKANSEIQRYKYYLNSNMPIEEVQRTRDFIKSNDHLMKLYGSSSPLDITSMYLKKVQDLRKDLAAKHEFQYLANVLEYFRFMCTRENIANTIPGIDFFENLSDSKFSALILGKASSRGQVAAIGDILSDRINTSMCNVGFYKPDDNENPISSYSCLTISDLTGKHYIDAYRYSGKMERDPQIVTKNYIDEIYPLLLDDITLRNAKKKVSSYLIKKLKINDLISSLELEGLSETEKSNAFIAYIKSHQDDSKGVELNSNTIMVNGELMEVSRLLELFYIASGIRYRVTDGRKENSTFEVILDDQSTIISLNNKTNKVKVKE